MPNLSGKQKLCDLIPYVKLISRIPVSLTNSPGMVTHQNPLSVFFLCGWVSVFLQGLLAPADFVGLSLGVSQQVAEVGWRVRVESFLPAPRAPMNFNEK